MPNHNVDHALAIEGMTTEAGLAIMDIFLQKSLQFCPDGLCFEFGTYKGRTAALIASRLSTENWFHMLESQDYLEFDKIKAISDNVTWHKMKSEAFCTDELKPLTAQKRIAYSHHDASHFFDNVHTELSNLFSHVDPNGIMVLDDFNDSYSQVRAAYYHLRYTTDFPFELLIIGFNKAILVHEDKFDYWEQLVLDQLLEELSSYSLSCQLCRSDVNQHSRNFFVRTKSDPTAPDLYGVNFWGDKFYGTSKSILGK